MSEQIELPKGTHYRQYHGSLIVSIPNTAEVEDSDGYQHLVIDQQLLIEAAKRQTLGDAIQTAKDFNAPPAMEVPNEPGDEEPNDETEGGVD